MKVLIVDDHPIVHAGLRRLIAVETDAEIREAATAKEAFASFKEDRPDLVIMDLNLPGIGGLEMIRRLMLEDNTARILVFSVHDDSIHVARAFEAGALGYVTKNAPPDQISLAIFRVAAGHHYIEPEIAQELALLTVRTSKTGRLCRIPSRSSRAAISRFSGSSAKATACCRSPIRSASATRPWRIIAAK